MVDLTLVLVPLLVLPIVLLIRFIGCGLDAVGTGEWMPPKYRDYIMSDPNATAQGKVKNPEVHPDKNHVVAYWRLVDPKTVPVSGSIEKTPPAKDEKGFQDGTYFSATIPLEPPNPATPGSEGSPQSPNDDIKFGNKSLIESDPLANCRLFQGGYVAVPYKDGLYPEQFTIEAWVHPQWGPNFETGYEHTLFAAGGTYRRPSDPPGALPHGFSVVADKTKHWQVRFDGVGDLFGSPPVATNERTHLAVTVEAAGSGVRVRLFVNGKEVQTPSNLVFYSPPKGAPLWIGVSSKQPDPTATIQPHRPVISLIQEVVLHDKALSDKEIENHVDINRDPTKPPNG